jgi:hypothetical protein
VIGRFIGRWANLGLAKAPNKSRSGLASRVKVIVALPPVINPTLWSGLPRLAHASLTSPDPADKILLPTAGHGNMNLSGNPVFITGGGSGVGQALDLPLRKHPGTGETAFVNRSNDAFLGAS